MRRRRFFGGVAAIPAVAALPAIAAPMVEMDVADVTPVYVSDFGPLIQRPSDVNTVLRRLAAQLKADIEAQLTFDAVIDAKKWTLSMWEPPNG